MTDDGRRRANRETATVLRPAVRARTGCRLTSMRDARECETHGSARGTSARIARACGSDAVRRNQPSAGTPRLVSANCDPVRARTDPGVPHPSAPQQTSDLRRHSAAGVAPTPGRSRKEHPACARASCGRAARDRTTRDRAPGRTRERCAGMSRARTPSGERTFDCDGSHRRRIDLHVALLPVRPAPSPLSADRARFFCRDPVRITTT